MDPRRRRLVRLWVGLAILLFAMRVPALLTPVPKIDEALYAASAARSVALGDPLPYRQAWQDKGPVQMWIYMLVFQLFGNYNMVALHLFAIALIGLGAIPVWRIATAASSEEGGAWAALLYIVSMNTGNAIPFNSETPAAIATVWAFAMLLAIAEPAVARAGILVFTSGFLGGLAFLTRQNYLLLIAALPFCIGVLVAHRGGRFTETLKLSALALAGFAAPCLLVAALFTAAGEFHTLVKCFWTMNTFYMGATAYSLTRILGIPNETMRMFLRTAHTPVVAGVFGMALLVASSMGTAGAGNLFGGRRRPIAALSGILALGFTAGGIPGLRFFSHYFVMAIPFWCILAGATIAIVLSRLGVPVFRTAAKVAIALSLALDLSATAFFENVLDALRWGRYGGLQGRDMMSGGLGFNNDVSSVCNAMAPLIHPGDTLFVWGFAPYFYLQAGLLSASRVINGNYLTGLIPWENVDPKTDTSQFIVPGAWDALMEDLERERPAFIIDASRHVLFASGKYPPSKFPPLAGFLHGYKLTKRIGAYDLYVRADRAPETPAEVSGPPEQQSNPRPPTGEAPDQGEAQPSRELQ